MNAPIHSRQFDVQYYELDEHLWRLTSRLNDDDHDIRAGLDISVPDMIVRDASVEFARYPLEECLCAAGQIKELIGANLFEDYSQRVRQLFMGPRGCPNVMTILTTSAPAVIYLYYPDQIKKGYLRPEEWWALCGTRLRDACIAHTLLAQKYAG